MVRSCPRHFQLFRSPPGIETQNPGKTGDNLDGMELVMPGTSERHPGGRPRTRERSPLFLRVDSLARRRGISISELAALAGISRVALYDINDPKVSTARAIADALGVTLDRLTREERPPPHRRRSPG